MSSIEQIQDEDERLLAEMGYKQELKRGWSAFSNFAISFTIISVLAGCFTTYGQAWNFGGPVAISWGWPLISIPILIIGFSMSEIVAKFPTAGGIYWWASRMGGPGTVGVIAPVSHAFCSACDRTRLTADGQVRNCLFATAESDLRSLLRGGATDHDVEAAWRAAMWTKAAGHGINDPGFVQPDRPMSAIGG